MRHIDIDTDLANRLDAFATEHDTTSAAVVEHVLADLPAAPIERAIGLLAAMVRERREVGGFMSPDHQAVLREARDLLAEYGVEA